ncbi:MAG: MerR family transcriptional regulator, light-induced transcriptional regulator [Mycobacteriales bacterium]|jgi:hypothetical protein
MRRLVLDGAAPAEAARIAVTRLSSRPATAPGNAPGVPAVTLAVAAAAAPAPPATGSPATDPAATGRPASSSPATSTRTTSSPATGRPAGSSLANGSPAAVPPAGDGPGCGPGGRILAVPGASPEVRGLARAAMTLDAAAARAAVELAVRRDGVVAAWNGLLRPVLAAIGARWEQTGTGVEVEHLLAETAVGVLRSGAGAPEPVNGRPVLLACAPGEQHCLPLSALAAALAEHRIGVRLLGGGLPAAALAAAVRRTGAAVVLVFAQLPEAGQAPVLRALPTMRPRVTVLAGGAGWAEPLPEPVRFVPDLQAAVDAVRAVVG